MELRRVVVTGLGAITPIGKTVPEFWDSLVAGVSGAGPVTRFDASKFRTQFACEVKDYDGETYFGRKDANKYDLYEQFALVASKEAVIDSGIDFEKENPYRCGVVWASGCGGVESFEKEAAAYHAGDGTPRFSPFFVSKMIGNMAAGFISIQNHLCGPNFGTMAACASSNNAILSAVDQIRLGRADLMITGGSEASITPCGIGGFNAMRALSTRNDDCQHASRPFSNSRDGFVLGEGAACLVLEELEHAKARGARIYAEFAGGGLSADAYHMTAPQPEGLGAKAAMENALEDAGLQIGDIDYINTHGTSTKLGDIAEVKAILSLFGEDAYRLNIGATKSMTGHLLGAAGAIEAVASVLAVKNGVVPPTINFTEGDEDPDIDYKLNFTFNQAQKREVRAAISNAFGFGGHNSSLIFKKY